MNPQQPQSVGASLSAPTPAPQVPAGLSLPDSMTPPVPTTELIAPVAPPATPPPTTPQAGQPMIPQAWAAKAKSILLSTANDPYEQSRQISALRADYIKQHADGSQGQTGQ